MIRLAGKSVYAVDGERMRRKEIVFNGVPCSGKCVMNLNRKLLIKFDGK